MSAIILRPSDRELWDHYVMENPKTIAWQLFEWSEIVRKHHNTQFYPLAALDGKEIRGILPLYIVKTLSGGRKLISVPYAVAGGIVADSKDAEICLQERAIELAQEKNIESILLKQYKTCIDGKLKSESSYFNLELPLTDNIGEVWNQLSEQNREFVTQSRANDYRIEFPSDDFEGFYRMLSRQHHRKGIPCVSKKWIKDLAATGMYEINLLRTGHDIVAGTMVKKFRKTISFPFTCSNNQRNVKSSPIYRLYWELIEKYSNNGYEICHSGRIPHNLQTDGYRLGWGGTKHMYHYQYYPDTTAGTEYRSRRGVKRKIFEAAWKITPRPIVQGFGPFLIREFP